MLRFPLFEPTSVVESREFDVGNEPCLPLGDFAPWRIS